MEMMQSFNKTIQYIESALDDEIDEKKIAQSRYILICDV